MAEDFDGLVRDAHRALKGSAGFGSTEEQRARIGNDLIAISAEDLPDEEGMSSMDALLQYELRAKELLDWQALARTKADGRLAVWKGDITTLRIGGVVNAANEQGLGCFQPRHRCIDNVIHRAAGPRLRAACKEELYRHGAEWSGRLPTGQAMVTPAFNLPSDFVLHTPGPVGEDPEKLASCYRCVLDLCREHRIRSVAFCCISTGLFGYPNDRAAEVAVATVRDWLAVAEAQAAEAATLAEAATEGGVEPPPRPPPPVELVVFNVFLEKDLRIYEQLLGDST